jgi:hypothetical protein
MINLHPGLICSFDPDKETAKNFKLNKDYKEQQLEKIKLAIISDLITNGIPTYNFEETTTFNWQAETITVDIRHLEILELYSHSTEAMCEQNYVTADVTSSHLIENPLKLPVIINGKERRLITFSNKLGSTLVSAYRKVESKYLKALNALIEYTFNIVINNDEELLKFYQNMYGVETLDELFKPIERIKLK